MSDEFDFDLGSDHEADMMAAAAHANGKRTNDIGADGLPNKRVKTGHGLTSTSSTSPNTLLANRILKERFGLKGFRLEQEAAITRVLDGGSAVVVFPTGGGKSLCYQVIQLCRNRHDFINLYRLLPCAFATRMRRLDAVIRNKVVSLLLYHH